MCAVLGIYSKDFTEINRLLLKELFLQSRIRGKHSTGISFYRESKFDDELVTYKEAIPSDKFVEKFDFKNIGSSVIGHCRYSTSDLDYNQPIDNGIESIVHNGVITQSDPIFWKDKFGYDCEGKNDSELILKCIESNKKPLFEFKDSSLAVIHLRADKSLKFYRNGCRPLWYLEYDKDYYISSTKDILKRTFRKVLNVDVTPIECESGAEYIVNNTGLHTNKNFGYNDLQIKLSCTEYYLDENN